MVSSCNVKNKHNPTCCHDAENVGERGQYVIRCKEADRVVDGLRDRFPFPEWCPLPEGQRDE